jgi:hypothetical protein
VYRLNSDVFRTTKTIKQVPYGFSDTDQSAKKALARLTKKFHPQSAVLYAAVVAKKPVFFYRKNTRDNYAHPFTTPVSLLNHSLRGPPVEA